VRQVFVHGFTQTAASWAPVIDRLPPGDESVVLDVPRGMDFVSTALALGRTGRQGTYVGYSMGGRLCLRLAVERPDLVEHLVLVSASPGIADAAARASRQEADERLAREIERDDVDGFLERWLNMPMFRTLAGEARGITSRQRDPAVLTHQLRALGQGAMEPLWDRLSQLPMPVTLVVGALDEAYVRHAQEMRRAIPHARLEIVEGAGHALHLERPDALVRILIAS
jgi:2-succinyl-6-hydroxy-2,4-cyclohexadiene-1-carboxylate synthase